MLNPQISEKRSPDKPLLIIQPLPGIGDMVWFLPHIRALARQSPTGKIVLITKAQSQAQRLFGHESMIDTIFYMSSDPIRRGWIQRLRELIQQCRQTPVSAAWILHTSSRYALAAYCARIPHRYGYGKDRQKYFLSGPPFLSPSLEKAHPIKRANSFLELHGIPYSSEDYRLTPSAQAREHIQSRLQGKRGHLLICLGFGATEPTRRWPLERFAELVLALTKKKPCTLLLCGSSQEAKDAETILHRVFDRHPNTPVEAVTDLPLDQTCALLQKSDLFIGNDSGLMNIAACLNIPTVGLFSSSEHLLTYCKNLYCLFPHLCGVKELSDITAHHILAYLMHTHLF